MQIGKKIYYELATGNVILDTGERQGSVVETTLDQDFESYVSLSQRVPDTVGCIQLDFGEHSDEFNTCSGYSIDITTQEIVFDYTPPVEPPPIITFADQIATLTAQNADLQTQLAQTNTDFAAFMDFYFDSNPE